MDRCPRNTVEMLRKRLSLVASVGLTTLLCSSSPALAQSLGAASSFAVEGYAGVTAAGGAGTVITGDVGASPTASITGFGPAIVASPFGLHANDAAAIAAQAAGVALFTALGAGACTDNPGPQMSGATFGPGIHCFTTTADLAASGTMTLSGAGVYIFRVPTAITANVLSTVTLAGADACNVFWQVGSAATLNGVNFPGNVVAQAGVTLGVGASLTGRALVTVGPVTLSGSNTVGGCSGPAPAPPPVPPVITTIDYNFSVPVVKVVPNACTGTFVLINGTIDVSISSAAGGEVPFILTVSFNSSGVGQDVLANGTLAATQNLNYTYWSQTGSEAGFPEGNPESFAQTLGIHDDLVRSDGNASDALLLETVLELTFTNGIPTVAALQELNVSCR